MSDQSGFERLTFRGPDGIERPCTPPLSPAIIKALKDDKAIPGLQTACVAVPSLLSSAEHCLGPENAASVLCAWATELQESQLRTSFTEEEVPLAITLAKMLHSFIVKTNLVKLMPGSLSPYRLGDSCWRVRTVLCHWTSIFLSVMFISASRMSNPCFWMDVANHTNVMIVQLQTINFGVDAKDSTLRLIGDAALGQKLEGNAVDDELEQLQQQIKKAEKEYELLTSQRHQRVREARATLASKLARNDALRKCLAK